MEKLCDKVDTLSCEEEDVIECDEEEDVYETREDDIIMRCKWQCDASRSIDEAIEKLHGFIDYLKALKADGYELTGPVEDDYGFLRKMPQTSEVVPQ